MEIQDLVQVGKTEKFTRNFFFRSGVMKPFFLRPDFASSSLTFFFLCSLSSKVILKQKTNKTHEFFYKTHENSPRFFSCSHDENSDAFQRLSKVKLKLGNVYFPVNLLQCIQFCYERSKFWHLNLNFTLKAFAQVPLNWPFNYSINHMIL